MKVRTNYGFSRRFYEPQIASVQTVNNGVVNAPYDLTRELLDEILSVEKSTKSERSESSFVYLSVIKSFNDSERSTSFKVFIVNVTLVKVTRLR